MEHWQLQEMIFNSPEGHDWTVQYQNDLSGWKFVKPWFFVTKEKAVEACAFYRQFNDVRVVRISRYLASGFLVPTVFALGRHFAKTED